MKKYLYPLLLITALFIPTACAEKQVEEEPVVEKEAAPVELKVEKSIMLADFEAGIGQSNFKSGMGAWNENPWDANDSYTDADVIETEGLEGPTKAIRLAYSVDSQYAAQNGFWILLNKFDASEYDHIFMDVKGDAKRGFTEIFKLEIKKPKAAEGKEAHELIKGSYRVPVTSEWTRVKIPLNKLTGLVDFGNPEVWGNPAVARKDLGEFVIVFQDRMVTKKIGTIYLDNIQFVKTNNPGPTAVDAVPRDGEKTEVPMEGLDFAKFLIGRLGGFPEKSLVKKEFPAEHKAFLMEVARDTWRFFDEVVDREHALPLDTIQIGQGEEAFSEGAWIGDYTNVTNIGVYLMCLVAAHELGFINREEAVKRLRHTMDSLEEMEYHESGFPYNYYDTTTLERTSYFVSLVDSGWLVAGLYTAKNAFPEELQEQAQKLLDLGSFEFFYDDADQQMYHGFYEHLQVPSDYHYGVFYTEPRAISYMAIARGEVGADHWYQGMIRTFSEKIKWQRATPKFRWPKETGGYKHLGGWYEWNGVKYIPSWGGSAFEALMPTMVLKEKELAPEGLGANNAAHVQGQIRYALEEMKFPVWGMSPSSVPEGGYSEYGASAFGSKGYKPGVVTPHASVLAVEYAPEAVEKNLRKLIELYPIYGEYGFYDAVTIETGLVARKYLALDQGMILVSLANYLRDGAVRDHFHKDPVMKAAEHLLTDEKFFEEPVKPEPGTFF